MKKVVLLLVTMLTLSMSMSAQNQTVRQNFTVGDANFNVAYWNNDENPNTANPTTNSFYIGGEFCSVGWVFDNGAFWEEKLGLDISKYDKLVIRVASCVGNSVQFRIFDYKGVNGGVEFKMFDDIVESEEEVEYVVDFSEPEFIEYVDNSGMLDLTNVRRFVFWNYWDVNGGKSDPESEDYDPDWIDEHPGASVTITLSAMYLERTLENGEKDYVDLLATNKLEFTDGYLAGEEGKEYSYIDNTGMMHMQKNAEAGFFFENEPVDWSAYKYLVVVPQKPFEDEDNVIRYLLTDVDDNVFDSGSFRFGFFNRARCAVQDLTALTTTLLDGEQYLEKFDSTKIVSMTWSLWGGVNTWDYGIAGVWLSNTCPTYSTGFGDIVDQTADFIIANTSENIVKTICLPYAAAICGAQVYDIAGIDDPDAPAELYARPYMGILQAGMPYIIRTNSNRNITVYRAGSSSESCPIANGALMANAFGDYDVEADMNYLVLNGEGDTFVAVTGNNVSMKSNTAYIDCAKLAKAEEQENGLVFAVNGAKPFTPAETAINEIVNSKSSNSTFYYDLSGRKVSKPTKGIYVKNGKKNIVK